MHPTVVHFLELHAKEIRDIVARRLGEDLDKVAVIPRPIAGEHEGIAVGALPLEFRIELDPIPHFPEGLAETILNDIATLPYDSGIRFGVWLRPSCQKSQYAEHEPERQESHL